MRFRLSKRIWIYSSKYRCHLHAKVKDSFGSCSFVKFIQHLYSILFLSFGNANLRWLHFHQIMRNLLKWQIIIQA